MPGCELVWDVVRYIEPKPPLIVTAIPTNQMTILIFCHVTALERESFRCNQWMCDAKIHSTCATQIIGFERENVYVFAQMADGHRTNAENVMAKFLPNRFATTISSVMLHGDSRQPQMVTWAPRKGNKNVPFHETKTKWERCHYYIVVMKASARNRSDRQRWRESTLGKLKLSEWERRCDLANQMTNATASDDCSNDGRPGKRMNWTSWMCNLYCVWALVMETSVRS